MSFFQRAATLAAMTFALAGLTAQSAPGRAAELDRTAIPAPAAVLPATPGSPVAVPVVSNDTPPASAPVLTPAIVTDDQVVAGDVDKFASLDAAIAAQDLAAGDENLRCLAGAIYFESKGEPIQGQLAVAEVIINRAKSGRFPPDLCGVVTQRGQFSFVRGGAMPYVDATRAAYRTAIAVAKVALAEAWNSPAPAALYFHERHVASGGRFTRIAAIGNHIFYR